MRCNSFRLKLLSVSKKVLELKGTHLPLPLNLPLLLHLVPLKAQALILQYQQLPH